MPVDMSTPPKPAPAVELGVKDALVHAGWLPANEGGRGRPSREVTEAGKILVADHGYRIKSLSAVKSAPAVEGETPKPVTVERVKVTTGIAELIPQIRGEDVIPITPDGKPWKLGIRGSCNNCGVSLTYCPCPQPMVFLDYKTEVPVTFRAKVK